MAGHKPKLIEVALPLAAINAEAAREKSIRHGHPSTLHLWWARRPLAAARAVIWASLVDDPSGDESLSPAEQEVERKRLFGILERLVRWESSNDERVLAEARAEIARCFADAPPPAILDPFGGGGAIALEAQRLGLEALSGDLNPVAVLIQRAMLEIPPRFAGHPPVHPDAGTALSSWERAQGLAADIEAYGRWMGEEAKRRIGHLYPDAVGPDGAKHTSIAWIWARTVESPDPAWSGHVPLVASWTLARRPGKPTVWIEPIIDRAAQTIRYEIRTGGTPTHERTVHRGKGVCIATGSAIDGNYIKAEALAGRMGSQLMAVVAEGHRGRIYCPATMDHALIAECETPNDLPSGRMSDHPQYMGTPRYGLNEWYKLFTPRQLTALAVLSDLLPQCRKRVLANVVVNSSTDDGVHLRDGGSRATAYADAIVTYLAFVIDKCADYWSSICTWSGTRETVRCTFGRQAIPMSWDYAEANPFSSSTGNWMAMVNWINKAVASLPAVDNSEVVQQDARVRVKEHSGCVISTDPPYYDAVPYSDISDFFYVWLRRNLSNIWPDECATLLTPKADELVADSTRHGSRPAAEDYFKVGMAHFMAEVTRSQSVGLPATIFYAYKATETSKEQVRSTGWDTFLQAVVDARLQVTATWPLRTELANRMRSLGSNALASSVVLACRPRSESAQLASRGEFLAALRRELPEAVRVLQQGDVAPVDIAQSTIGPGMRVFSRYAKVVETDGSAMPVREALAVINDVLGEVLDGEEADLDGETRFALAWYSQHGFEPGPAGDADGLARAKNTSLEGIERSGIGAARAGQFRLHRRHELDPDWSPDTDPRLTVWEAVQHLAAALERSQAEAAQLLNRLGGYGHRARQLAYLLYRKADQAGRTEDAIAYNALIVAWPVLTARPLDDGQQQTIPGG